MERKKQGFIILTFVFSLIGAGFMCASLATQYWVEATPMRNVTQIIKELASNISGSQDEGKFEGSMNFGLFYGYKMLNYGFGSQGRSSDITVSEDLVPNNLINFGLWVATIVFAGFSLVWGLVTMGFAILNVNTKPIETLTGPMGLYLWTGFALFFTLLTILMWTITYHMDLKINLMTKVEHDNYWTSENRTWLSFSFWFTIGASISYAVNFLCIYLSGTKFQFIKYQDSVNKAAMDGVMMY